MKKVTAKDVRAAIAAMPEQQLKAEAVCLQLDLIYKKEKKPVYRTMMDMSKRGELAKIAPGLYQKVKLLTIAQRAPLQQRMWAIIRMRRSITAFDLASLAACDEDYAREYLQTLVRQEVMRRIDDPQRAKPSLYQLLLDAKATPCNEEKAARLRALREKKKSALTAINAISATADALRKTIEEMEVEE